jgi:hypothetical protein
MDNPLTNIVVTMTIPPVKYQAAAQEIMSQYGNVVQQALTEIREKLLLDKPFQEEVKNAIIGQLDDVVRKAVKSAAEKVVWDLFYSKDTDIRKLVANTIEEALSLRNQE